jgi:polyferredoxin
MDYQRLSFKRQMLQGFSLLFFLVLIARLSYPLEWESLSLQWVSRLDPWLLLSRLRWQDNVPGWVWLPLLTIVVTLLWGRIFCGWLCPLGAFLSLTDKAGRTVIKSTAVLRDRALKRIAAIRYYWLLFLVLVFALGPGWTFFLTPFALLSHELVRIFQGTVPWLLLALMAATLLLSRIWCSVLCPTGVLLSLVARFRFSGYSTDEKCSHCKICLKTCPVGAAPGEPGRAKEPCLLCGDCRGVCPSNSIHWHVRSDSGKNQQAILRYRVLTSRHKSRRRFFKAAFTAVMAAVFWHETAAARKLLRPPGALPELQFGAVCNRCSRCIQVCPSKALRPMPFTAGLTYFETPHIIPRQNRCDLCMACQEVCPTGAIMQMPLEKVKMGTALIDKPRCIAWQEDKLCFICGEQCPVLAVDGDEHHRPRVLTDKCVGCGSCENACPVDGDAAIRVLPK